MAWLHLLHMVTDKIKIMCNQKVGFFNVLDTFFDMVTLVTVKLYIYIIYISNTVCVLYMVLREFVFFVLCVTSVTDPKKLTDICLNRVFWLHISVTVTHKYP